MQFKFQQALRNKWILFVGHFWMQGRSKSSRGAIKPTDDYMCDTTGRKADQIQSPETIADDRRADEQRAGHQGSPGQTRALAEVQIAIGKETEQPNYGSIERCEDRPGGH